MAPDDASQQMVAGRLRVWVEHGLLTPGQAERILAFERDEPVARTRAPASLLAEALGYVGGVLVLVAVGVLTGRFWTDLGTTGRPVAAAVAAAVLIGAGAAVPGASTAGSPGRRLRAVLWLAAVAVVGFGAALLADDVARLPSDDTLLVTAAAVTACAGVLWWRHRTVAQQAAVVVGLALLAAAAAAHLPRDDELVIGLAIAGVGVVWLLLGWGGIVAHRTAADLLGGLTVLVGTTLCVGTTGGSVLALASGVALVAAGVGLRDLVLLPVGAAALLVDVPVVVDRWFPDALAAPLALLAVGGLLVVGALVAARRGLLADARHRGVRGGSRPVALTAAAVVALGVAVAVVAVGTR